MSTAEFILEIVKVMVPVLTGLLVLVAKGVGTLWERKQKLTANDFIFVSAIAVFGFLSFGCWAGALAGAVINSTGGSGTIYWFGLTANEALSWAREFLTFAYNFFVVVAALSGGYYLSLLPQVKDAK